MFSCRNISNNSKTIFHKKKNSAQEILKIDFKQSFQRPSYFITSVILQSWKMFVKFLLLQSCINLRVNLGSKTSGCFYAWSTLFWVVTYRGLVKVQRLLRRGYLRNKKFKKVAKLKISCGDEAKSLLVIRSKRPSKMV